MELTIVTSKRKILWEPEAEEAPVLPPPQSEIEVPIQTVTTPTQTIAVQPNGKRAYKARSGNGHKSTKIRDLYDTERDSMRFKLFLPKNGQISDDDCVAFRSSSLPSEVSIFQVTGFISVLHTEVAEGRTQVNDLPTYETWMRLKYGGTLWARYNHPLYVKVRGQNLDLIAQGLPPTLKVQKDKAIQISLTPKFTAPLFKKKYAGA